MTRYEARFYEDIHKLVTIQEKILKELEKMNKPLLEVEKVIPRILTDEDQELEEYINKKKESE